MRTDSGLHQPDVTAITLSYDEQSGAQAEARQELGRVHLRFIQSAIAMEFRDQMGSLISNKSKTLEEVAMRGNYRDFDHLTSDVISTVQALTLGQLIEGKLRMDQSTEVLLYVRRKVTEVLRKIWSATNPEQKLAI